MSGTFVHVMVDAIAWLAAGLSLVWLTRCAHVRFPAAPAGDLTYVAVLMFGAGRGAAVFGTATLGLWQQAGGADRGPRRPRCAPPQSVRDRQRLPSRGRLLWRATVSLGIHQALRLVDWPVRAVPCAVRRHLRLCRGDDRHRANPEVRR